MSKATDAIKLRRDLFHHETAVENIVTRNAIENLKRTWSSLGFVRQGEASGALKIVECTEAGLAGDFRCSVETIQRLLKIAALPPAERAAVEAGGDPDDYLLLDERRKKRVQEAMRLRRESVDGRLSTELSKKILHFLAVRAPEECCNSPYFKGALFDELDHRIHLLSKDASLSIPPDQWVKQESITMSKEFVILDPSGNPPPGRNDSPTQLDKLVTSLTKYVMRVEWCLSIIENALPKVRQLLESPKSYSDVLLLWRARILNGPALMRQLTERLTAQNSLSAADQPLVA
jgi:hypothetical protein